MEIQFETWIDYLIFFIILVKIVFMISAIGHIILSHSTSNKANSFLRFHLIAACIAA